MEDRKAKAEVDEREAQLRQVRAAAEQESPEPKRVRKSKMPSAGMTLDGKEVVVSGAQPINASGASTRHGYTAQDEDDDEGDSDDVMEEDTGSDKQS